MPDGKYAILAPAPGLKRCYQDVGGRHFATYVEAKAHARRNLIALIEAKTKPDNMRTEAPTPRKGMYLRREDNNWYYQRFVPADLFRAYPEIFPKISRSKVITAGSYEEAARIARDYGLRDTQLFQKLRQALKREKDEAQDEALQPHD